LGALRGFRGNREVNVLPVKSSIQAKRRITFLKEGGVFGGKKEKENLWRAGAGPGV